jgi:YaiO family outer membrane protein
MPTKKNDTIMIKKILCFLLLLLIITPKIMAQKINTDSLLVEAIKEFDVKKNFKKAKTLSQLGYKIAPDYLDFQVELGKNYLQTKQYDSARFYFKKIITTNIKYKEAFSYLIKAELEDSKIEDALVACESAMLLYPDDRKFYLQKLEILESKPNNENQTFAYLKELLAKYPTEVALKLKLFNIKTRINSDRIGFTYNFIGFDRENIGPNHLLGLQYIRVRKAITLIGKVNLIDRRFFGKSVNNGLQYEVETYFTNNEKSYSFASLSLSNDNYVFPKLRAGYSYFRNFRKGWEGDIGLRYTKGNEQDSYAAVLGLGRYINSYWLNLRSYLQKDKTTIYPSFAANARYYYNTKYDYISVSAGYGSTPDERLNIGVQQQKSALKSYRVGAGYYKLFWKNYFTGIQASLNKQEYSLGNFQNELELFCSIQYKFKNSSKPKTKS